MSKPTTAAKQYRNTYGISPRETTHPGHNVDSAIVAHGLIDKNGSVILAADAISLAPFKRTINAQTGTSYTIAATDNQKVITLSNAGAITLTVPNSLPVGFECTVLQKGAGLVTWTAGSGTTLRFPATKTAASVGQYGTSRVVIESNSTGAAAVAYISGDLAAA